MPAACATANRRAQQSPFTNSICATVEHGISSSRGLAKMTARHRARLTATGSDVGGLIGNDFRARVESDVRKWKSLVGKVRLDG